MTQLDFSQYFVHPHVERVKNQTEPFDQVRIHYLHVSTETQVHEEAHAVAHRLSRLEVIRCLEPEVIVHADRVVIRTSGGHRVRGFHGSGAIDYKDLGHVDGEPTEMYDLADAAEIATAFMDRHALWPLDAVESLKPDDLQFDHATGMASKGGLGTTITVGALVAFRRFTSGIPWIGPGARVTAHIVGKEVVGFERHWRQVIPQGKTARLIPIHDVLADVLNSMREKYGESCLSPKRLLLESIAFGYYAADRYTPQRALPPCYRFIFKIVGQTGVPVVKIISACEGSVLNEIIPPAHHHIAALARRAPPLGEQRVGIGSQATSGAQRKQG